MIIVDDNEGLRIDSYLSEKLELSRSKVQKLIKENKVMVNGKNVSNAIYSLCEKIIGSLERTLSFNINNILLAFIIC